MKVLACLIFLSTLTWRVRGDFGNNATEIDQMRHKLIEHGKMLEKELFNPRLNVIGLEEEKYLQLIQSFKTFGNELEQKFPTDRSEYLNSLNSVWLWARTENELKAINGLYNIFRQMQREIIDQQAYFDLQKLADFSRTILYDLNASMVRSLTRINEFIVHDKLFISAYQEASSQICSENQSLQELLYNLYTTITLSEIKGYAMIQFSYLLLRLYNPGTNFTEEMELIKQQYAVRTSDTVRAVKTAMAFAPKDVWKCDPRQHKLDETYTQLTQLFQGYIVNEVDLNRDSSCRENCAYYGYSKVHGCYKDQFCTQQRRCNGKILNCEYVDSDMWICPSAKNSSRRYEYIEYENGGVYGQKKSCSRGTTKVDSWWRWLFWHCSYCFCYCDDNHANSDRYISLRDVVSDVANNKVVTGIALKKVNQVMHIQIQEGELMPRGNINKTTVSWKPIEAFSILDSHVKNGIDYHTLAWETRGLDLDDLVPAQDHLLTGVRFRTIGPRLNLEIMVTPFNFTTGRLIQPLAKSFWLSNDVTNRIELKLENPDIPTRLSLPALPDSKPNQYLNFAPSSRQSDAAQNTIPFFDIQPIETKPPVPISGAGIFHKGRKGSGGFVAFKLITYDFTSHLQVDLPPAPPIINTSFVPHEIKAV
ncbi:chemokine-like protein orion isoform X2 [Calliopsis andreniformis]|uniref:chemokine-like protein orion isoform X2 n=1 Tax=Calliopsis andreniformis TaxID=337506 RepID=UPI003FCC5B2C